MKKFLSIAVCLVVLAMLCVPSFAEDSGYYIKSYDVQSTLHENNTVSQTETVTVHFNEARHGIFRSFPENVRVTRTLKDGTQKNYDYRIKIKNAAVNMPNEAYSEDGYYYIKIGDADSTVSGDVTYYISFTYDVGDDRMTDYDEIFYSLNGPDWDTHIESFTFNMTFEKPIPSDSAAALQVYSGTYGATGNDYIEWTADENGISGHSTQTLPEQTSVTVQTYLPEGYFTGERMYSTTPAIIAGIIFAVFALFVLIKELFSSNKRPVQTVEFYPPDDISSAEVGFIIDEASDDKDIISLVIWFAGKGYLTITETKKKKMQLHKVKDLPATAPQYQRTFFSALFNYSDDVVLNKLPASFYDSYTKSKLELAQEFKGKRALHKTWDEAMAFVLPLITIILYAVFASLAPAGTVSDAVILPIASAIFMAIALFVVICAGVRWTFSGHAGRILFAAAVFVLAVVSYVFILFQADDSLINSLWLDGAFAITLIICLLSLRLAAYTQYRTEMAGKLLGLRSFIQKAEVNRLKLLVEQDPEYYYNIIPYAYVFNLSNVWAKKFESIAVPPPSWYIANDNTMFNMIMFDHMMHSSFSSSIQSVHTSSSSSGSGGSFGGGGGFSGGGFGGGGGGSW